MSVIAKYAERKARAVAQLGGECVSCGSVDNLQFDHIKNDRTDRNKCISRMMLLKWEKIEAELSKCQLLCINCHATKSNEERGGYRHGSTYTYVKLKCKCDTCKRAFSLYNKQRRLARV